MLILNRIDSLENRAWRIVSEDCVYAGGPCRGVTAVGGTAIPRRLGGRSHPFRNAVGQRSVMLIAGIFAGSHAGMMAIKRHETPGKYFLNRDSYRGTLRETIALLSWN
jgi:hypothetical protein